MSVRKEFSENEEYDLSQETIDKLLVLTILIKFLEEKKDAYDDRSTLGEIYTKYSLNSIEEVKEGSQLLSIIEELSNEFNGQIFDQFTPEEKSKIRTTNLFLLSNFLRADVEVTTGQTFLWRQYSFQHLPAEVISAIYENFIQAEAEKDGTGREKGVVYTPIHLVNFLIDEVMPLDSPPQSFIEKGEYKILDPTCGSGVFLVAAYKRLLQWWAITESQKTGQIAYPDVSTAQKLLEDNIFGLDVKGTAVRVTIFGLTTALLDFLSPKEVWGNLKFKDLTLRNIVLAEQPTGFFKWALEAKKKGIQFSLAVGNPPFNPEKKVKKEAVLDKEIIKALKLKHNNIPRKNFALHFFESAMQLSDRICMIVPSNVLLYDKSANSYRRDLFTDYIIKHIYDFTHLRRELFTSADTPVLALIGDNMPSNFESINHTVVKRTISAEQRTRFEIDEYDIHHVKWDWAVDPEKQFIWKTNLLGGGRLFHFIQRFSLLRSLRNFTDENTGWFFKTGYKRGGNTEKKQALFMYSGDEISTIDENGSFQIKSSEDLDDQVEYYPDPMVYTPPVLIIDQVIGNSRIPSTLIKEYHKDYIYFNRDFVGIHCPQEELIRLELFYKAISENCKDLYRIYALIQSGSGLIMTETEINKRDLDSIPFPKELSELKISESEEIIQNDIIKYYIHLGKAISVKSDGSVLHREVTRAELKEYGNTLCSELNNIYARDGNTWQIGKVFKMNSFTVFQIGFGIKGELHYDFIKGKLDRKVEELINNEAANRGATFKRVVRLYNHIDGFDCVYFLKPNALRYWLKSIALRDADETFVELRQEGF